MDIGAIAADDLDLGNGIDVSSSVLSVPVRNVDILRSVARGRFLGSDAKSLRIISSNDLDKACSSGILCGAENSLITLSPHIICRNMLPKSQISVLSVY